MHKNPNAQQPFNPAQPENPLGGAHTGGQEGQPQPTLKVARQQAAETIKLIIEKPEAGAAVVQSAGHLAVEASKAASMAVTGGAKTRAKAAVKFTAAASREAKKYTEAAEGTAHDVVNKRLKEAGAAVSTTRFAHNKPRTVKYVRRATEVAARAGNAAEHADKVMKKQPAASAKAKTRR